MPDAVHVKKVDYSNQSSIVDALRGQDALIITMGVTAPPEQETKLIEAAAEADVPWVLPNEFGTDGANEQAGNDVFFGPVKRKSRDHIEKLGKSSWIGIVCGFWYEYSLSQSPFTYGFDFKNKTVKFYDDGTRRLNTSTWPQTGRAVANLLALNVLPNDKEDQSLCLAHFRNKFLYVSSFTVNQREMLDSVLRVTGANSNDWTVIHTTAQESYQEGIKIFQSGNRSGFAQLLYSRMFFPDQAGYFEAVRGLDNDKIGLPKENLDDFTKVALGLVESHYSEYYRG